MENVEEITRIMKAGSAAGRAQEPMRFVTQEERNAWYEEQTEILAKVMAPVETNLTTRTCKGIRLRNASRISTHSKSIDLPISDTLSGISKHTKSTQPTAGRKQKHGSTSCKQI